MNRTHVLYLSVLTLVACDKGHKAPAPSQKPTEAQTQVATSRVTTKLGSLDLTKPIDLSTAKWDGGYALAVDGKTIRLYGPAGKALIDSAYVSTPGLATAAGIEVGQS